MNTKTFSLYAGTGRRDITPPVGTPLAGRPKTYPAHRVHDPLQAKAIYFAQGDARAMLISLDLILLERNECLPVRRAIAEALDMPLYAVVIATTHTHTGPGVGDWAHWEGREAYEQHLFQWIVEAAQEAQHTARPARLVYASAERRDLCHNRRYVMSNGRVETHPPGEGALHPDGPIDPQIQAVRVEALDGTPMAMLAHFACHPTAMGWKDNAISADYPHWIERGIQTEMGADVPVAFFPGALGDVSDGIPFVLREEQTGAGLAGHLGTEIAREILEAFARDAQSIQGDLSVQSTAVRVPAIDMGPERQSWANRVLQRPDGHADTDVRDAKMILEMCATWPAEIATDVALIAIGDLAFYTMPGEVFCWYGLELKRRSRFKYPVVLGLANDRIGYIADRVFPTKDIFNQPLDFERRMFGSTGDAGEILVRAALGL